jgi:HAD superfamily hydrolase (TIGR01662 family)
MIRAVLLDLDDTLLDNDMERFLPPYFVALSRRVAPFVESDKFVKTLLTSTRVMMHNQDPTVTNEQVFEADFFPRLGLAVSELRPTIASFYEEDFAALKRYTAQRPQARPLIQFLLDQGYDVVIATNPMFPRRAIEHRLEWAGVLDFPLKLVTTLENSHFCKPNPQYYAEVLDKLECGPHEAIMVGDDFGNDIEPASRVGLHTYWIVSGGVDSVSDYWGPRGTLADFCVWAQEGALNQL